MKHILFVACVTGLLIVPMSKTRCQDPPASTDQPETPGPKTAAAAAGNELSVEQARMADRFKRLEEVVGRLAELSASTDPRRAKLLREAIAQSREQDLNVRFEKIVKLLEEERLSAAATNQTELQKELDSLLSLLLKADRDKELSTERERVKQYLKEVARLIRLQKDVRGRTENSGEFRALGDEQKGVAADTGKLSGQIDKSEGDKKAGDKKADAESQPNSDGKKNPAEPKSSDPSKSGTPSENNAPDSQKSPPSQNEPSNGKPSQQGKSPPSNSPPSEGQPGSQPPSEKDEDQQPSQPQAPADRASNKLRAAQQQMEEALKKLEEAQRKGAVERQQGALKALELAKAELERVLRQLREEELERTLTQLAARFRKMLDLQNQIYDGTLRIDHVEAAKRGHDQEIEAARLSRLENQIIHDVEKALLVLREEGSSVAFPEAVEQIHDDMKQVAERLAAMKVEKITQGLEEDIIAALEETIAALEKASKDLEKKRTPPGQQPMAGQPDEMPLVEKLAELKMIRSLQMRINKRTQHYGQLIKGEQAETPELLEALSGLAERQQRVYRATADLGEGRND
jgi:hypothetical protein